MDDEGPQPLSVWARDGALAGAGVGVVAPLTLWATITAARTPIDLGGELTMICAIAGTGLGATAGLLQGALHRRNPALALLSAPTLAMAAGFGVIVTLQLWNGGSLQPFELALGLGVASLALFGVAPPQLAYLIVLGRGRSPAPVVALIPVWTAGVLALVVLAAVAAEKASLWSP